MLRSFKPLIVVATLALLAAPLAAEELPTSPAVKQGTLDNGVRWMWRPHDNPEGKLTLLLYIDVGSVHTALDQRGYPVFLEHLAFRGTENFTAMQMEAFFREHEIEFGPGKNANSGFLNTSFAVQLQEINEETVEQALKLLSDIAFRMTIEQEQVDRVRGTMLSRLYDGVSAQQRVRDAFFEEVFGDTYAGKRTPLGTEETVKQADATGLRDYYRKWFRPERVALVVAGDAELAPYQPLVERWFGQYRAETPAPEEPDLGLRPFAEHQAHVLTDPEYPQSNLAIYRVLGPRPPTTSVALAGTELLEQLGSWIMGRRFRERIKDGDTAFVSGFANAMRFLNVAGLATAGAAGPPDKWQAYAEDLMEELNRARQHGFLPEEYEAVKTEFLEARQKLVDEADQRTSAQLADQMVTALSSGEPYMSPRQELDLFQRLLAEITVDQVTQTFQDRFKLDALAFVLTMPEQPGIETPTAETLLAKAKPMLDMQVEPPAWVERPETLLAEEPTPGAIAEKTYDEELKVTSAWLSNGVRVHHRMMPSEQDLVLIAMSLAGGQIEETPKTAGQTAVASLILLQPATKRLRSADIRELMANKAVQATGQSQDDALTLSLRARQGDLEAAFKLAHAVLAAGKLEERMFADWKQAALDQFEQMKDQPQYAAFGAFVDLLSGGDPRHLVMMTPEIIEQQSIARSQAWFEHLTGSAPLEVAVVGDVEWDALEPLLEKYVASLPERPRQAKQLDALRQVKRSAGPYERTVEARMAQPLDVVIYGFVGCHARDVADVRALNLASVILRNRLGAALGEKQQLVRDIGVRSLPAQAYENMGYFFAAAPTQQPGQGEQVLAEMKRIYSEFAESGPTAEELAAAKRQIANGLERQLEDPGFWLSTMQTMNLHDMSLDMLRDIVQSYQVISVDRVRDTFARYYTPSRTIAVVATPADQAEAPAAQAPAEKP